MSYLSPFWLEFEIGVLTLERQALEKAAAKMAAQFEGLDYATMASDSPLQTKKAA